MCGETDNHQQGHKRSQEGSVRPPGCRVMNHQRSPEPRSGRRSPPATARATRQKNGQGLWETCDRPWTVNRGFDRNEPRLFLRGEDDESWGDDGVAVDKTAGRAGRWKSRRDLFPEDRPHRSCPAREPGTRPPCGPCKRVVRRERRRTESPTPCQEDTSGQRCGLDRESLTWRLFYTRAAVIPANSFALRFASTNGGQSPRRFGKNLRRTDRDRMRRVVKGEWRAGSPELAR